MLIREKSLYWRKIIVITHKVLFPERSGSNIRVQSETINSSP